MKVNTPVSFQGPLNGVRFEGKPCKKCCGQNCQPSKDTVSFSSKIEEPAQNPVKQLFEGIKSKFQK